MRRRLRAVGYCFVMHDPIYPCLILRDDVLDELQLNVNEAAEKLSASRVVLSSVSTAEVVVVETAKNARSGKRKTLV